MVWPRLCGQSASASPGDKVRMARILHNDEWYEEVASWGHYESEFERVLAAGGGASVRSTII